MTLKTTKAYAYPVPRGTNYEKPPATTLGKFIHEVRAQHRLDKTRFAKQLGVNQSYVGQMESGEKIPGPKVLEKIHHMANQKGIETIRLVYAWLEAHELYSFVTDIKAARGEK